MRETKVIWKCTRCDATATLAEGVWPEGWSVLDSLNNHSLQWTMDLCSQCTKSVQEWRE